jgi:hypothetical protein
MTRRHGAAPDSVHEPTRNDEGKDTMGKNTPKNNKLDQTAADQKLMDGLNKHAQAIPFLLIAGAQVPITQIVATLQARLDATKVVAPARASWQALVQAERDERAKTKALISAVKQALLLAFAGQIDVLADFGLTPRKKVVRTPAEKQAATTKARATRKARHTMGSKQKAEITGENPQGTPAVPPPAPTAGRASREASAQQPQGPAAKPQS